MYVYIIYIYLFVANANYKNLIELLSNFALFANDFVYIVVKVNYYKAIYKYILYKHI